MIIPNTLHFNKSYKWHDSVDVFTSQPQNNISYSPLRRTFAKSPSAQGGFFALDSFLLRTERVSLCIPRLRLNLRVKIAIPERIFSGALRLAWEL